MDLSGEYNNYYYGLEYYGGCGGYKTKVNMKDFYETNMHAFLFYKDTWLLLYNFKKRLNFPVWLIV